jgi:hypothetical protein
LGVLICNILSTIIFEEEHYETLWTVQRAVVVTLLLEWFWTAIIHKSIQEYSMDIIKEIQLFLEGLRDYIRFQIVCSNIGIYIRVKGTLNHEKISQRKIRNFKSGAR